MRILCLLLLIPLAGCARDADLLTKVFRRTGAKIETAAGGSANQFANRLRTNASPIGLADRVKTRLQWDRFLEGISVEIESTPDGVVKVKGQAPDAAKKQRVLDLTQATTGVKEVIDEVRLPKEN